MADQESTALLVEEAERQVYGSVGEALSLLDLYVKASTESEVTSWAYLAEGCLQRFVSTFEAYQELAAKHGRLPVAAALGCASEDVQ